jgi:type II secretory pathway pseudopilin PulG
LIELVAVLAILSLAAGFIIARANRIPAFLTVETSVNRVKTLFLEAANQALARGETVTVEYLPGPKTIQLGSGKTAPAGEENPASPEDADSQPPEGMARKKYQHLYTYSFPPEENFKVVFPEAAGDSPPPLPDGAAAIRYSFYADGSADGPPMRLEYKGQKVLITISPLTGMINVSEADETEQK